MSNSENTLIKENKLSSLTGILSLTSIFSVVILFFLIYSFFSGSMYRFYASALFLFYSLTQKMWISVILLGVFQTLVLIPLRIIRVQKSENIKALTEMVENDDAPNVQIQKVKTKFSIGDRTFLFYLVDFAVQLTTFLTIGRLFLTDFYSRKLDPNMLFSFVPYPHYPIQSTFFKIPYLSVTETVSKGFISIVLCWIVLLILQLVAHKIQQLLRKNEQQKEPTELSNRNLKYSIANGVLLFLLSWFLMTHVPTGFKLAIFSGDVSQPNSTLNTVTAVATFLTLLWFGFTSMQRKVAQAREAGMTVNQTSKLETQLFRESLLNSTAVGLGAYFITNRIPSAFELSIFTLEIISLLSPLTLDKAILAVAKKNGSVTSS